MYVDMFQLFLMRMRWGGRVKMERTVRVHSYIIIKINRCC
jgi:hypothetical protein